MKTPVLSPVVLGLFLMVSGSSVSAQSVEGSVNPDAVSIRQSVKTSTPAYLQFRKSPELNAGSLTSWSESHISFRSEDAFQLIHTDSDAQGITHSRLQQTYKGVPVEGGIYILHSQQGKAKSLNGDFFAGLDLSVAPAISKSHALRNALESLHVETYMWEVPAEENHLKETQNNPQATYFPEGELVIASNGKDFDPANFQLCWKFDVYAQTPFGRSWVYIDAQTGNVFQEVSQLMHVDAIGSAQTHYSGARTITTDYNGSYYRLRENGRGQGIETYDLNQTPNFWAGVDFADLDNVWNNVNPQMDEVATDAHWGAEMTYDYFWQKYNRNSINGIGFKLLNYVHYSTNFNNALWDGQRMIYGDGDGVLWNPIVCLDAVGHEISHGLTQFTSNLDTRNEAGALNEAFSDIFAVAIDFHTRPTVANWTIAEEARVNGTGIRNLANPAALNNPDTYQGTNWDATLGNIHNNSTVVSHWFYLMSVGGSGTNDNGDNYSVTGIGVDKAAAIAYRTNTYYLSVFSDFADARFYAIQSAIDLYGACSPEVFACADAWYAVGVGGVYTGTVTADFTTIGHEFCQGPASVRFYNNSINAANFHWDFGDGATSTLRDPVHLYTSNGNYTVTLIADGGQCGADTLSFVDYVKIDPSLPCNVNLDPINQNVTQTSCTGNLYDSGGPNADYHDQSVSFITLSPTAATNVTLTFSQFDYRAGDTLRIYDGPNLASPLIGKFSGNSLPNGGVITATNGHLTLLHRSDLYLGAPGFAASWSCSGGTTPAPVPAFTANDVTPCGTPVQFTDQSTGNPTSWAWNFGDGTTSNVQNPSHTYTANGNYSVTLTATNAGGQNTLVQQSYIQVDEPTASVVASGPVDLCPGYDVTLTASGGTSYQWSNGSTFPGLNVNQAGSYSVTVTSATGCTDVSAPVNVTQLAAPTPVITPNGPTTICAGNTVTLSATGGTSYQWSNGATGTDLNVALPGNYFVVATGANGCQAASATVPVQVSTPTATVSPNGSLGICPGASITLSANAGSSYLWSDGSTSQDLTLSQGGTFSVTVTDAYGCSATTAPVTVVDWVAPTVAIAEGDTVNDCTGNAVTLTATGGNVYQWSNGVTGPTLSVTSSGNYYVVGSNQFGCADTSGITVVNQSVPTAVITPGGNTDLCEGNTVNLTVSPAGIKYVWSTGDSSSNITVGLGGLYGVTVTDSNGCEAVAPPVPVTVAANPIAEFDFQVGVRQVSFSDLSSPVSNWTWTFGDGNSDNSQNPSHNYTVDGNYMVKLEVTEDGCSNFKEYLVSVPGFGITAIEEPTLEEALAQTEIWPNPFQEVLHINSTFPTSGDIEVDLTDLLGRPILSIFQGWVPAGEFNFDWSTPSELAKGVYLFRMRKGDAEMTRRVVHIK